MNIMGYFVSIHDIKSHQNVEKLVERVYYLWQFDFFLQLRRHAEVKSNSLEWKQNLRVTFLSVIRPANESHCLAASLLVCCRLDQVQFVPQDVINPKNRARLSRKHL